MKRKWNKCETNIFTNIANCVQYINSRRIASYTSDANVLTFTSTTETKFKIKKTEKLKLNQTYEVQRLNGNENVRKL